MKKVSGKHDLRYFLRVPVRCRILDDDGPDTEFITETVNISSGGFFIRISERLRVGSQLALFLKIASDELDQPFCELACTGRISWEQPFRDGSYGYDIEIEEAAPPLPVMRESQVPVSATRH